MNRNHIVQAYLELPDLIRINQLIRTHIDFDQFKQWYDVLAVPQQCALITKLCEFAYQAGFTPATYQEALAEAGLEASDPLIKKAASFHKPYAYLDLHSLHYWAVELTDIERFTVFRKFVYLFGKAEGNVYKHETKEGCNHWWHRNLLDERVVHAILSNPRYYYTSMKDDDDI